MADWTSGGGAGGGGADRDDDRLDGFGTPGWGRRAVVVTGVAYAGALVVSVMLLLMGRGLIGRIPSEGLVTAGLTGLLLVLTLSPIALIIAIWASTSPIQQLAKRMIEVQEAVRVISEQAALSDDARRVLNRATEREMLCRAIEQDIANREWEAAIVLCTELADRFGYRVEAEGFRARIERARIGDMDAAARESVALIDGMLLQRRWSDAAAEAARLARLYPQTERIAQLPARVDRAKADYKEEARKRFVEAAAMGRYEEALALLRDLDGLMSEAEAGPLRETARSVVAGAREALGAHFKAAVEDEDWADAATIGRRIIAEFPNTRMAVEVREMLDGILSRANAR
ncbi:MAG: hypothetical protein AB7K52_02445 [Phycisphaerales bacterium]